MTEMNEIEAKAKRYAVARARLAEVVGHIEDEKRQLLRRHAARLRRLIATTADRRLELTAAVEDSQALFTRPKTRVLHGIQCGYRKGKGKIVFEDADAVVRAIFKHLPDKAEALVKITEKPIKPALERLSAAELKRIGVTVEGTGDEVLVKPADGEIDKLIEALLTEPEPRNEEAA